MEALKDQGSLLDSLRHCSLQGRLCPEKSRGVIRLSQVKRPFSQMKNRSVRAQRKMSFISQLNNFFTPFVYRFGADFTAAPARLNIEDFVLEPNQASLKQRNIPSAVKMHTQIQMDWCSNSLVKLFPPSLFYLLSLKVRTIESASTFCILSMQFH